MIPFEVTILGNSSAIPTSDRHPTSQVLNHRNSYFLIDCGECAQQQIRKSHLKFSRIKWVLISHLHGDHFFGLFGLISTFQLLGRKESLIIYAPPALEHILKTVFSAGGGNIDFEIDFRSIPEEGGEIFDSDFIKIKAMPLNHSTPCYGFHFQEKNLPRKIDKSKIEMEEVPIHALHKLKDGEDVQLEDGRFLKNSEWTLDPPKPRSYTFITDTRCISDLADEIKGTDMLYHEATFLHEDKKRAIATLHTTAKEAGAFAKKAEAKMLLIGHFSARYDDLKPLKKEAQTEFEESFIAKEGKCYKIKH